MRLTFEQNAHILGREAFSHRRFVVGTFIAVTALATLAGLLWPRVYKSTSLILVNNKRLIAPLIKGAAYQPDVGQQRAKIAQDLITSREILMPAMAKAGLFEKPLSPRSKAAMLASVRSNASIMDLGKNLISVSFKDTNPLRAYHLTHAVVAQFIGQDRRAALQQAQGAYTFLQQEVASYRHRLAREGAEIKRLKANTLDANHTFARYERRRVAHLRMTYDKSRIELKEDEGRVRALEHELTGHGQTNSILAQQGLDRSLLIADEARLQKLQLYYRKTYPGIQALTSEIHGLRAKLTGLTTQEKTLHPGPQPLAFAVGSGGFFRKLEHELDDTQARVATLQAEAAESQTLLRAQMKALHAIQGSSVVSALLHNYAANQQTLNGLLKRREQARVSLNLNKQRQALSFRVYEQATHPIEPIGPPFSLFVIGGIVLGLVLPFGLLYGRSQMDARVRAETVIPETLNLPLLAVVPHLYSPSEVLSARRSVHWLGILMFSVLFIAASIVISGRTL
ncbi:hypothetical protein [Acidiferrobacter sp.]|jgi:polysaccharide chain length determinant protein (PEP-CTERM system associated)|uniref:hypothetical protein n=1 Tax=Acidiferrobacter sp. TaxID=1872107 RepID=UPI0026106A1D|nr:hypothetical protein [Acidiferrobacter sp.]